VTTVEHRAKMKRKAIERRERVPGFTPVPRKRVRLSKLLTGKATQYFEPLPNGGYRTLHHTKGWRTVSPKRLKYFPGSIA
jgi:hypothetical protein